MTVVLGTALRQFAPCGFSLTPLNAMINEALDIWSVDPMHTRMRLLALLFSRVNCSKRQVRCKKHPLPLKLPGD